MSERDLLELAMRLYVNALNSEDPRGTYSDMAKGAWLAAREFAKAEQPK